MATKAVQNPNNPLIARQQQQPNNNAVQANGLQLIQSQDNRIRELEQQVMQAKVDKAKSTGDLEKQLFLAAQQKDQLAQQLADSQQQLQRNQAALEDLQRRHEQDAQQIAQGLLEIRQLNQQMRLERQRVQLLGAQYAAALQNIDQLNARIQEFEKLQREILANLKQQPPKEPDLLTTLFGYAKDSIWRTFNGLDPKLYQN